MRTAIGSFPALTLATVLERQRSAVVMVVASLVLLSSIPQGGNPGLTFTVLGAYWVYFIARASIRELLVISTDVLEPRWVGRRTLPFRLRRRLERLAPGPIRRMVRWREERHLTIAVVRAAIMLAAITAYVAAMYLSPEYLQNRGDADTLWLLFLLGTMDLAERGRLKPLLYGLGLAAIGLGVTQTIAINRLVQGGGILLSSADELPRFLILAAGAKFLWVCMLAVLVFGLVSRLRAWWRATLLLERFAKLRLSAGSPDDKESLLSGAVAELREVFGWPSVLVVEPEHLASGEVAFRCVAAAGVHASARGRLLTYLPDDAHREGVFRRVFLAGEAYRVDTPDDPVFRRARELRATKAELAVPLVVGGEVLAVLSVESPQPYAFEDRHRAVLQIAVAQLGPMLAGVERLHYLDTLSSRAVERLFADQDVPPTLQVVAEVAVTDYGVARALVFAYDEVRRLLIGPYSAGIPVEQRPEPVARTPYPGGLLDRLLRGQNNTFFHGSPDDIDPDDLIFANQGPLANWDHPEVGDTPPYPGRVVLRLETGGQIVGILWLNLPRRGELSARVRQAYSDLARLAAAALQKALTHENSRLLERRELARDLHDHIKHQAYNVVRVARRMLVASDLEHRQSLEVIIDEANDMQRAVDYFILGWEPSSSGMLEVELRRLKEVVSLVHPSVSPALSFDEEVDRIQPALVHGVLPIVQEAVHNAIIHGHARQIAVTIAVEPAELVLTVNDDGSGYTTRERGNDPDTLSTGVGRERMQERAVRLGGVCVFDSVPGSGLSVTLRISLAPLPSEVSVSMAAL